MEKDQDYAWIIVGAGTILMLVAPSTYSTCGLLFEDVNIGTSYHIWMLNTMYNVFMLSGMFAGPLSTVFTQRKIAMVGCLIGAIGFLMAALTLKHHVWLFVAFAGFVGIGLGLAFHVTFLLVMSKFEKYQGLANGVLQLFAGIGYFLAPYIYNILVTEEDRFHIKALVTALAFVGAILYISPETWQYAHAKSDCRRLKSVASSVDSGSSSKKCGPEALPLMELQNSEPIDISGRMRKRSHYLLAVSASMLPNIPEESEGPSAAATGTCTPVSHTSMNNLSSQKSLSEYKVPELTEMKVSPECLNSDIQIQPKTEKRGSTVSFDDVPDIIAEDVHQEKFCNNNEVEVLKHTVERLNSEMYGDIADTRRYSRRFKRSITNSTPVQISCLQSFVKALKSVEFKFIKNMKFLTMAIGGALGLLSYPTVPIVLYAYLNSLNPSPNYNGEGETALLLIFSVDVISRLLISYASDFSWLSRRSIFFLSSLCGSIVAAGMGFSKDFKVIYILCIVYGVSQGALIAMESIMLAEDFGISAFPTTYGIYHLIKVTINLLVTVLLRSPTAAYTYAIHSLTPSGNEKYIVYNETYPIADPLDLFSQEDEESDKDTISFTTLFLFLSIPGIFSAMISTGWNVWVRLGKHSALNIHQDSRKNSTDSREISINKASSIEV